MSEVREGLRRESEVVMAWTASGTAKVIGSLAAFFAGASFGLGGAASQIVGAQGFSIMHITAIQYVCAAVILGVLVLVKYRPHMNAKEVASLCGVGALSVLSNLSYYLAIDLLSVGQAVAIQFQYVWIVVAIQSVVERKRPSAWIIAATVLVLFGTLFGSGLVDEVMTGAGSLSFDPLGIVFAVLCACCYAGFIYLNGRVATEHQPVTRTFFMMVAGSVIMAFVAPDFYTGGCDVVGLLPGGIVMGLVMGVIPCVGLAMATKRLPGGIVAILSASELPVAVLAGCLLLGEQATPLTIFGVVVICVSIVLSQMEELKATRAGAVGDASGGALADAATSPKA